METKQIKELMTAMERTRTKKLSITKDDFELVLEREDCAGPGFRSEERFFDLLDEGQREAELKIKTSEALSHAGDNPSKQLKHLIHSDTSSKEDAKGSYITSPMVGTFYTSPSPDENSFIKVGQKVEKNTIVCIIEAMKVMNEIKANASGTISEILIESGQPVEFGTKLFRIVE